MLKEIELENKWNEQDAYRSNLNKLQKKDASKSLYKIKIKMLLTMWNITNEL